MVVRGQALRSFKDKIDAQEVPSQNFEAVRPFLKSPRFTHDAIVSKSKAAGGICSWVANIVAYYDIFCDVHPKRLLVARARTQLEGAQMRLGEVRGGASASRAPMAGLTTLTRSCAA